MIVDDRSGDGIPGIKAKVIHDEGVYKELVSDRTGTIKFENLKQGFCDLSGSVAGTWGAYLGNTRALVGTGKATIGSYESGSDVARPVHRRSDPRDRKSHTHLAGIIGHKVRSGETLRSIAQSYNMTSRDLAYFNWGTYDHRETARYMKRDNWVKLQFPTPPPGSYVNLIQYHGDDEEPHYIFLNVSEKELT